MRRIAFALACVLATACKRGQDRPADLAPASGPSPATAAPPADADLPSIQPAELAAQLGGADRPLLIHVGFKKLYEQAHIPGSEYAGPGSEPETLARLRERLASVPRDARIVIYCGCCPWDHCPNVRPAYALVRELGFTRAVVLAIPNNFGDDWAAHGYPVAQGL